ncbi:MAG: hypothetical protein J2P34_10740, partial [Actinobacteria bacterium]|nr:hypothetical protein [Actinomycetota bacterium]
GQAPVTDGPGTGGTATPAAPDQVFSERALRDSRGPRASAPGPADPDIEPGLAGPDLAFGPAGPDLGPGPFGEDPGGRGRREPGPAGPVPEGLDPAAVGLDGPDPAGAIPPVSLYPAGREPAAIEPTSLVPPARPGLPDESPGPAASGPSTIPGFTLPQHPAGEARPGSDLPPASGQPGAPVPLTLAGLAALMRSHIRETVAVILLGIGGLVLPFPFWLLGAGAAALSRFWEVRIKWLALIGPPLFVLVVSVPIAAISRGHGNLAGIYAHVLRLDLGYLIRIGCVVTAAYLGWLVRRGPRARVPPWRR